MRIGLAGWYGYGNLGDDLILRMIHDTVPRVATFSTRAGRFGDTAIHHVADLPNWSPELDLLLIGGGGLLNDRWIAQLPLAEFPKPYGFVSVGIPHARWLGGMDDVLSRARFVTLRDHHALDLFREAYPDIPAWWLPDPVFALRRKRVAKRALVVLNPRAIPAGWVRDNDPPDSNERQVALMCELIDRFSRGAQVIGIGFEESDRELLRLLPCPTRLVGASDAVDLIARAAVLVTARLHGGIIAATQGTRVALIDHQDKIRGLGALLEQPVFPLAEADAIYDAIQSALQDPGVDDVGRPSAFGRLTRRTLGFMTR